MPSGSAYAEADPTFDIEGNDTAHKLALLTSLAFGTQVDADAIYVEGISAIAPLDLKMADDLGFRIKLLGVAERTRTGIEQRVHPTMVPRDSAIAQVMGVTNAVTIDADAVGELTLIGPGAGGDATASAVLADIADVAGTPPRPPFGWPVAQMELAERAPMQRHEGGYYVRLAGLRSPGRRRRDRKAHGGERHLAGEHPATPFRGRRARSDRALRRPGAGGADHLCDERGRGARGDPADRRGRLDRRGCASHPDRERIRAIAVARRRSHSEAGPMADKKITPHPFIERILTLELVRVTERAAVSAARLRGRGDEKAADQAAVDAMRRELNKLQIDGTVVIGEGERDEAPMLFIGERVGNGDGPKVDIAVDPPLEGTTLCAKDMPGSVAVMAMAEAGTLLAAPDVYMNKIAIGPGYPKGVVDLDASPAGQHSRTRKGKGRDPLRHHRPDPRSPAPP